MNEKDLKIIENALESVLNENSELFSFDKNDWYNKRNDFLEQNKILNEKILDKVKDSLSVPVSKDDLFQMQKLYLLYPSRPPKKLLSLSWNCIKLILSFCEIEKRKFYTDICYYLELDEFSLKEYILNDLYEKVVYLISEIQDYDVINEIDFLEKVIKIQEFVFEN